MTETNTAAEPHAVVVEDEPAIARFVEEALRREGFTTESAGTLREGLRAVRLSRADLLIVDLGLPDGDGSEIIARARAESAVPIIVLSARTEEAQKVKALDLGADDYLTKPFGMAELLARVRAQMRRRGLTAVAGADGSVVHIGDVEVDLAARTVKKRGELVHLTKLEFRLLQALVESRGKVLTQRVLLQQVWGSPYADRPHYLRIYMQHLRTKLEDDPARPKWFVTEIGVGYRLAV